MTAKPRSAGKPSKTPAPPPAPLPTPPSARTASTVDASSAAPRGELPIALAWTGVVLLALCGAASAWLEALLVPYYVGGTVVPLTIVATLIGNWYLPRLARTLVPSTVAAVAPFVLWLAVIFVFAAAGRPEGDVILPGGGTAPEYVGYAVMLGGALVGTISIVTSAPPPTPRRAAGRSTS